MNELLPNAESYPGVPKIMESFGGKLPLQPKAEIAERLRGLGFNVPNIFPDLESALSAGGLLYARSEHPAELAYSGISDSYLINPNVHGLVNRVRTLQTRLGSYSQELGIGYRAASEWYRVAYEGEFGYSPSKELLEEFGKAHSLSYWEYAEGTNFLIARDAGGSKRYYIKPINRNADFCPGVLVNDGEVVIRGYDNEFSKPVDIEHEALIEFYERVRTAKIFDEYNYPIIECVHQKGMVDPTFLQYHPTRQRYNKDREEVKGSTKGVLFVRGTTPDAEEIIAKYFDSERPPGFQDLGSFVYRSVASDDYEQAIDEYYLRKARVNIITLPCRTPEEAVRRLLTLSVGHLVMSMMFGPEISVFVTEEFMDRAEDIWKQHPLNPSILKINSDGADADLRAGNLVRRKKR